MSPVCQNMKVLEGVEFWCMWWGEDGCELIGSMVDCLYDVELGQVLNDMACEDRR